MWNVKFNDIKTNEKIEKEFTIGICAYDYMTERMNENRFEKRYSDFKIEYKGDGNGQRILSETNGRGSKAV
jgi:hypothetical protein